MAHLGRCPDKIRINPERGETKSDASHRTIGLPDKVTVLLRSHRTQQLEARMKAGDQWHEGDSVFTDVLGYPLSNTGDYRR